uniref:Putative conserved secreted protein n=1 Tax=Ixodes ricinus TaxID=34613 RepID=V5GJ67_IXORI
MWYEILPSVAIISVCMSLPNFLSKYLNLAVDGKPYRRDMIKPWNLDTLMRDERLTGNPYKQVVVVRTIPSYEVPTTTTIEDRPLRTEGTDDVVVGDQRVLKL